MFSPYIYAHFVIIIVKGGVLNLSLGVVFFVSAMFLFLQNIYISYTCYTLHVLGFQKNKELSLNFFQKSYSYF